MTGSTDGGQFEPYGVDPSIAPGLPRPEGWRVGLPDGSAAWDKVGPLDTDWALVGAGGVTSLVAGDPGIVITNPGGPAVTVGQVIAAEWTVANYRIYAVDFVNGLDTNAGFADAAGTSSAQYAAACAAAGAVAKKTFAGLAAIFPRVGNGRLCEIVIANGGLNTEQLYAGALDTFLAGTVGWGASCPTVRGTGTNATAGSVAFAGTTNEFDFAGGITATGCNGAGYNPTGTPAVGSVQCLKVGGGAAAIPAEPAIPLGWRMRFDNATTTATLRNVCRQIAQVAGTDTLIPQTAWPAVPVGTDTFYLEQAGVACGAFALTSAPNPSPLTRGYYILGIRSTGALQVSDARVRMIFCGAGASVTTGGWNALTTGQNLIHAILGTRTPGGGLRLEAGSFVQQGNGGESVTAGLVVAAGNITFGHQSSVRFGAGSYVRTGLVLSELLAAVGPSIGVVPQIGGLAVTLAQPRLGAGPLSVFSSTATIGGCSIVGTGGFPAIIVTGRSILAFQGNPCTGATGNTDVGLDLTGARGSLIILTVTPTVTGALGDVRLAGGQIITWAQAIATGIVDSAGNRIIGTAGAPPLAIVHSFSGVLVGGGVANTANYLKDIGFNVGGGVPDAVGLRRPTSLRLITRMRVTNVQNTMANICTVTLEKNGVATAMAIAIPAGTAANTKFVDAAHPILFLDGDDFDLIVTDPAADPGGLLQLSATLEGPA